VEGRQGDLLSFQIDHPMKRSFGKKDAIEVHFWERIISEVDCKRACFQSVHTIIRWLMATLGASCLLALEKEGEKALF
jgi:hypothetical protein